MKFVQSEKISRSVKPDFFDRSPFSKNLGFKVLNFKLDYLKKCLSYKFKIWYKYFSLLDLFVAFLWFSSSNFFINFFFSIDSIQKNFAYFYA